MPKVESILFNTLLQNSSRIKKTILSASTGISQKEILLNTIKLSGISAPDFLGALDKMLEEFNKGDVASGLKVIKKLRSDREFMDKFERYYNARVRKQSPELNKLSTDEEVIQAYIETLGVGPTKAAQIVACKPEMIERIK